MKKLTLKDFINDISTLLLFPSKRKKVAYILLQADSVMITVGDVAKTKTVELDPQALFKAFKELGAEKCTDGRLARYVDKDTAPACAALIYSLYGEGRKIMRTHQTYVDLRIRSKENDDYGISFISTLEEFEDDILVGMATLLNIPSFRRGKQVPRRRKMENDIYEYVVLHAAEWIGDLPALDLEMLRKLLLEPLPANSVDASYCLLVLLGFLVDILDDEDQVVEIEVYSDLHNVFRPLIDEALAKKVQLHEDVMETALFGLLNTVGWISRENAIDLLLLAFAEEGMEITKEQLETFMAHSMLVRLAAQRGRENGRDDLLGASCLMPNPNFGKSNWQPNDYPRLSFKQLQARGSYTAVKPYSKEDKDFVKLLTNHGLDNEDAMRLFSNTYLSFWGETIDVAQVIGMLFEVFPEGKMPTDADMEVISAFANNVPRPILSGHTPIEAFRSRGRMLTPNEPKLEVSTTRINLGARYDDVFGDSFNEEPIQHKEVGRNDPCPCGSGKKYKKCCGREN